MITFILNEEVISTDKPEGYRALDFIRNEENLKGTKEGCREGDCGACLVLLGEVKNDQLYYYSVTSCLLLLGELHGKHVVTIEGLNQSELNPLQEKVIEEHASQCGFCTPGILLSVTGYLMSCGEPDYNDLLHALDGNICRCTGYSSIKRVGSGVVNFLKDKKDEFTDHTSRIDKLVEWKVLPDYFTSIKERLNNIEGNKEAKENKEKLIPVAGGTDLVVQRDEEVADYDLYFINQNGNKLIEIKGDYCYIGASASVNDIYKNEMLKKILPEIDKKFYLISSTPIRNMATLGGNLVNASPIGDLSIFFLALESEILLKTNAEERIIPLNEFFIDYKKLNKKTDELIQWLRFRVPTAETKINFEKVSKRERLDIASVNTSLRIETKNKIIKDISLSAGGVAPVPLYFKTIKERVVGREINKDTLTEIVNLALEEISPISDVRGSKEYKKLLLQQLIKAHFITLLEDSFSQEVLS